MPARPSSRRRSHTSGALLASATTCPVISVGACSPSSPSIVGATSAKMPSRSARRAAHRRTRIRCTGLVVCAVNGPPSSSIICSALPWSAVISVEPPSSRTRSTMRPMHVSTTSSAVMAAVSTPVWPTMSALAKFSTTKSYGARLEAPQHFVGDARRRSSPASGRTSPPSATGSARGPRSERLLAAAVEEVRDVRVLLRLGDAQLLQPASATTSPRDCRPCLRRKRDRAAERGVVLRHAHVVARRPAARAVPSGAEWVNARVISRARSGRKLKKMTRVAILDHAERLRRRVRR